MEEQINEQLKNNNLYMLRHMSGEQLAGLFSKLVCHDCKSMFHCKECHPDDDGCASEILKWLHSEPDNSN